MLIAQVVLHLLRKYSKEINKIRKKIHRKFFWNGLIRFLIEAYFEITLAIGIQVTSLDKSFGIYAFSGVVVSLFFGVAFTIISLFLPFFIIIFYPKRVDEWSTKVFKKKFGTVLAGLDREPDPLRKGYDKRWALFFQMLLLLRRLLFVIAVIGAPDFLVLHFLLLFASSTSSIIFLLSLWPTIKPRDTKL